MRRSAVVLAIAVLAATLAAIFLLSRPDPGSQRDDRSFSFPITFADDEAVTVTVSSAPSRIVVAAPHLTEFIFAAGEGTRVVGATGSETKPPEATVLPAIVGADGVTPVSDKVKQLSPDLVLASGFPNAGWKQQLREAGITVVTLNARGVQDAIEDMRRVGDLIAAPKASAVLRGIDQDLRTIGERIGSRGRPRVFVEVLYPPLTGAGPVGFTADLINQAGGELVSPIGAGEVFVWNAAELSKADPDLYLAPTSSASDVEAVRSRSGFGQLGPVREGTVHVLPDDVLFSPGPRMVQGLERLAKLFHPGLD